MFAETAIFENELNETVVFLYLKLVSAIFYQIFIFSLSDSPTETVKNVFHFIFVLEIFKFLEFCLFLLSTLSRFKRTNGSRKIYYIMNGLA